MNRWRSIGRRLLNVGLIVLIGIGGVLTWRSGQQRNRLWNEYERMYRVTGDLAIADPARVHLRAIKSQEPLDFVWRAYFPPNYVLELRDSSGGMSSGSSSTANEFIARVRLRVGENGLLELYNHFGGGSSRSSIGDQSLAAFVRAHARELQVEQLGTNKIASIAANQPAVLLRVNVPDNLRADAQKELSAHAKSLLPTIYKLEIGPKPTKP